MATRHPILHPIRTALRPSRRRAQHLLRQPSHRPSSTTPSPLPPPPTQSSDRISRILSRLPSGLQKYTSRLRAAPVSHVTAFLILHELTAIVPLFALFGLFHYYADVGPVEAWMRGHYGTYVSQGTQRFEKYFRRKGWFGFSQEDGSGPEGGAEVVGDGRRGGEESTDAQAQKYKVVVEVALAYAITKALLPLRIVGSVWATPWFASVLVRLRKLVRPLR
ncbi:hypothetical protein BR93DRAFT_926191 [Coniochaeta sp. PMI_546]|nr:hypothetical protein BR93DRAFT_926191 [Coniochaeta sp. PMI_546]